MTVQPNETAREPVETTIEAQKSPLSRWIEDPFASALLATGATATAVGCVLTGMWLVNISIS